MAVRLTDERWIGRILRNPDLRFGEAYMAAVWSLVRAPVFATYLALGVTGAIVSGVIFQMVV